MGEGEKKRESVSVVGGLEGEEFVCGGGEEGRV